MHPIFTAIDEDDKEAFESILNEIDDINNVIFETLVGTTLHIKQTPLHVAAIEGRVKFVKQLLKKNANIYTSDAKGRPPLFTAIININNYMRENPSIADNYCQIFAMILRHELKFRKENLIYQNEDLLKNRINEEGEKILNKLINWVDDKKTRRKLRSILREINEENKKYEAEYAPQEILINTSSEKIRTADEYSLQSDGPEKNDSIGIPVTKQNDRKNRASSWSSFTAWNLPSISSLTQFFSCSLSKEKGYIPLPESDEDKKIIPKFNQ